ERPNITPVELGNVETPIDTSFLHENTISSPECYGSPVWSDGEGNDEDEDKEKDESDNSDEETPGKSESVPVKRKRGDSMDQTISAKPRRGPKQATSEKAVKPMWKSTNPLDRFADISKAKEATLQKKIDLRRERNKTERALALEKIRVSGQTKVLKVKIKVDFELAKLRMQQEHEFQMKYGYGNPSEPSTLSASMSNYGSPSEPSTSSYPITPTGYVGLELNGLDEYHGSGEFNDAFLNNTGFETNDFIFVVLSVPVNVTTVPSIVSYEPFLPEASLQRDVHLFEEHRCQLHHQILTATILE
ncbi:hypothetical protein EV368DRAFT_69956, partial [Lentinula lateritia]